MKPDDETEHGLWVVGPTVNGSPTPAEIIEGTWQTAQEYCGDHEKGYWVQGRIDPNPGYAFDHGDRVTQYTMDDFEKLDAVVAEAGVITNDTEDDQ